MVEGDCDEVRDTQSCGRKLSVRCDASSFFLLSLLMSTSVSEDIKSGGKNQKYARRLWCQHAGPGAPDAGSHPEALSQRIHSLCRCSQKRAQDGFASIKSRIARGEILPSSSHDAAVFSASVDSKGPGTRLCLDARLSPPQSFTHCTALATLVSLPVFFSKPSQHPLSTAGFSLGLAPPSTQNRFRIFKSFFACGCSRWRPDFGFLQPHWIYSVKVPF